jgi:predicted RNA binding protein YcfA (HicA-like mRNA interferase family)
VGRTPADLLVRGRCPRRPVQRAGQESKLHQVGSHIILETSEPTHHRIAIPGHHLLRRGTLSSILRAVARHKGVLRDAIIADL